LHVHFTVLEQNVELSNVIAWIDLNHSEETVQFFCLAFSFFLGNIAVVLGLEASWVLVMFTLNTGVVLEVTLGEFNLLALLGALGLALGTLLIFNTSWVSSLP
jgi:hypothetical protein